MKSSLTDHLLPTNNHCPDPKNVCCILPYSPLNIGAMSVIRSTVIPICHTATTNEGIGILNNNNLNTSAVTTSNTIDSPKSVKYRKNSGDTLTVTEGLKETMGQLQMYPARSPQIGHRQEESETSTITKDQSPRRDNAHLDSYKESDILQIQSRLSPEPNMGKELKLEEISVAKPRCGSKVLLSTNRNPSDQGGCAHYIEGDFDSAEEAMEELECSDKNCKASTRTPSPHSTGTGSYRSASQSSLDSSESHKADLAYHHHTDEETNPNECSVDYPIQVPIIGYETMEQRARFTVFKLQVIRSPHDSWFVFRRYTDFVFLSDKIVQHQLKNLSPDFFIPLPPKRWFLDNFDRHFLEERRQGLQEFINRILSSKILCECKPVREFFCLDDPPGPHDSLEESRALCESLEEQTYNLKKELRDKEHEIDLLKSELNLYKSQIEDLKRMERLEISGKSSGQEMSPASGPSEGSDQLMDDCPEVDQNNYEGQLAELDSK